MPQVTIAVSLSSPQPVVAPRLVTVLRGYAERDDVTLAVEIGIVHAAVSVPVSVQLLDGRTATSFPFQLAARDNQGWFPTFRGAARSDDDGRLASRLVVTGTYAVPFGPIGAIVNAGLLRTCAESSLRAFVRRFRDDVLTEIRRSELDIRRSARLTV